MTNYMHVHSLTSSGIVQSPSFGFPSCPVVSLYFCCLKAADKLSLLSLADPLTLVTWLQLLSSSLGIICSCCHVAPKLPLVAATGETPILPKGDAGSFGTSMKVPEEDDGAPRAGDEEDEENPAAVPSQVPTSSSPR